MSFNLVNEVKHYEESWTCKESRSLNPEELESILSVEIVPSDYGTSGKMRLATGGCIFIPCSNAATFTVGQMVDPKDITVEVLTKPGKEDIFRIK